MANLRTNNLSGEQGQNAYRGSVFFAGNDTGTALRAVETDSNFTFGSGDFTIEFWLFRNNEENAVYIDWRNTGGNQGHRVTLYSFNNNLYYYSNGANQITQTSFPDATDSWYHIALARENSSTKLFVNGLQIGSTYTDGSGGTPNAYVAPQDSGGIYIGRYAGGSYDLKGYISNLRIVKGTALYTSDFTPPQSELTVVDGTVLLCCQDSDDATKDAVGTTITTEGNLNNTDLTKQQPKVIPPYGVDAGNTFGGPIQQSTQGYMYFPTGRTEERGGSRGILAGGHVPSEVSSIDFFNIQSTGNSLPFGDLTDSYGYVSSYASHTRAVHSVNFNTPVTLNTLEFITIATQGNALDFGDRTVVVYENGALSNETRGLVGGGYDGGGSGSPSNTETIDFNTIASLGNSTDFGDLTLGRRALSGLASPTRGIFAAGYQQPDTSTKTNVIDFVTIASTGNASNFGDLITARWGTSPASSTTRGVFAGGATPTSQDSIDFITIASTGDATDFGDLTQQSGRGSGTSDSIRGVFKIGYNPSTGQNTQEFVTIATTGNAKDFGDSVSKTHSAGMTSNAHGGLS